MCDEAFWSDHYLREEIFDGFFEEKRIVISELLKCQSSGSSQNNRKSEEHREKDDFQRNVSIGD